MWLMIQPAWRSTQEAEGTPLERVQVVNSGARVQIPPSPFCTLTNKQQYVPENPKRRIRERAADEEEAATQEKRVK